jgi:hypothetical protein
MFHRFLRPSLDSFASAEWGADQEDKEDEQLWEDNWEGDAQDDGMIHLCYQRDAFLYLWFFGFRPR